MVLDAEEELPTKFTTLNSLIQTNLHQIHDGATSSTESSDADSDTETPDTNRELAIAKFGQKATVKKLYEGPPKCKCCINWVEEIPDDISPSIENTDESKEHALLVRMRKSHNNEGDPLVLDSVVVQSPQLKKLLSEVFKEYDGITTNLERLVFRAPFRPFFHEWASLGSLIKQSTDPLTVSHAKLLRKLLKSELKETLAVSEDLKRNEVMMYEYLWTMFRPGTEIFTTLDGHNCIYKLINGNYVKTDEVNAFQLQLRSIDVDGAYLGYRTSRVLIHCFAGTKPLKSLEAFPVVYHPFAADVREQLTQRGSRFREFHTNNPSYKAYKGIIITKDKWCDNKRNVDSRIVVDAEAYLSFNANKSADLDPLEGVTFKSPLEVKDKEHDEPKSYGRAFGCGTGMMQADRERKQSRKDALRAGSVPLSEDLLYLCSPQVKGYCLKTKKWATFYIDSIQEIKWNEEAFESLVLPTDYKRLILSFVESQIKNKETFDDVIEGKGQGLIMLLQGSPGVGKTLTAEALADRLRKPLYALSAGELGHTPDTLEKRLTTILDIAAKWDAVLLLDESDVFLEARSADNLARNGVVAIFLRLLEYFRGILFMTTNRVHGMDPAFRSRIHLTINYPKLRKQARRQIWERLVGVGRGVSEEEFEKLADWEVNGREVKNIVKTAQLLAAHEGVDLAMEHIETVVRVTRGEIGEGDEDDEKEVRKVPKETVAFNPFPEDVDVMEISDQVEGGSASKRLRRS